MVLRERAFGTPSGQTAHGLVRHPVLSIAAGAHFAVAFRNVHYADLDGHLDLTEDPARGGATIRDGHIIPADAPGLRVEVTW